MFQCVGWPGCTMRSPIPVAFSTSVGNSPPLVSRDNELCQYQHVFLVERRFNHPYMGTGATYDDSIVEIVETF